MARQPHQAPLPSKKMSEEPNAEARRGYPKAWARRPPLWTHRPILRQRIIRVSDVEIELAQSPMPLADRTDRSLQLGKRPRLGLQRLDPDEGSSVIVADPQLRGIDGLVDIDSANVRLGRKEIVDDFSGFCVEPRNMIVAHPTRPGIGAVVEHRVIRHRKGRRKPPLLESLRLR